MNLHESSWMIALGWGLWTSVQPCPLTTNLAAVSYLGRRSASPRATLLAAILYAVGQAISYVAMAILVLGGAHAWRISTFLQDNVNVALGPIWILTGMFLLELLTFRRIATGPNAKWQSRIEACGIWGALPLGMLLALAFCPVSAACFFASLLTMAMASSSCVVLPLFYALGAALPVVAFAMLLSLGTQGLGGVLHRTQQFERGLRRIAGTLLVLIGIYYAMKYNFQIGL